jgi:hypothetical protein
MPSRWLVVLLLLIYPAVARSQMTFGQCQFQCGNNHVACTTGCPSPGNAAAPGAISQCNNTCTTVNQSCLLGCGQLPFLQPLPARPIIPIPGINQ